MSVGFRSTVPATTPKVSVPSVEAPASSSIESSSTCPATDRPAADGFDATRASPMERPIGSGAPSSAGPLQLLLQERSSKGASVEQVAAVGLPGASSLSAVLHVFAPEGRALPTTVRRATLEEAQTMLVSDESDDIAANTERFWAENPGAYYRWDVTEKSGEPGLITDMARATFYAAFQHGGDYADPETLPFVVTIPDDGKERIAGFGTFVGDVHFHTDSRLRAEGYKGLGTAMVAAYLRECLKTGEPASFQSVNNSYGFYEKVGFAYSDPAHTPTTVTDPATDRFSMHLAMADIPAALERLAKRDAAKLATTKSER